MTGTVDFTKNLDTTVLKGKCALVTGGASGIGAKTVALLAGNGSAFLVSLLSMNKTDLFKSPGYHCRYQR